MQSLKSCLEYKVALMQEGKQVGERVYHLFCHPDSPTSEAKEALCHFIKYIGQIEESSSKAQAEPSDSSKIEPISEEAKA
jgi:hypothetical protein